MNYTGCFARCVFLSLLVFPVSIVQAVSYGIRPGDMPVEPFAYETVVHSDASSEIRVLTCNWMLDYDALTKISIRNDPTARALVPLNPSLVCGEGPDPSNHTVIRILSTYQVPEVQFLAFPSDVRGGVGVDAGFFDGEAETSIVAHTLLADVPEIRVFNRYGGERASFRPTSISAPYVVAVGDLLNSHTGDEIAVMSRQASGTDHCVLYSQTGQLLMSAVVPASGPYSLCVEGTELRLYNQSTRKLYRLDTGKEQVQYVQTLALPADSDVYPSVQEDVFLLGCAPGEVTSELRQVGLNGSVETVNVGTRENLFYFSPHNGIPGKRKLDFPDGRYVKEGLWIFSGESSGDLKTLKLNGAGTPDPAHWEAWRTTAAKKKADGYVRNFNDGAPRSFSPIQTHRRHPGSLQNEGGFAIDPETGLPRYLMLDRHNESPDYLELNSKFANVSYAAWDERIYRQRAFLQTLAPAARTYPEKFIAIEPCHEHEIHSNSSVVGDFHPDMLTWFYWYLMAQYGSLEQINTTYGTPFTDGFFDAPRNKGRGAWDTNKDSNAFYLKWYEFNSFMIYRWIGMNFREALLAGFAPECITSHQIPDSYAIASLNNWLKPAKRITPIDWIYTAGAGYGFTRYGLWYKKQHNCVQGGYDSGHGMVVVGEYHPSPQKTISIDESYKQLLYMYDHGIFQIHCMPFDSSSKPLLWAGVERLTAIDRPRPGVAGGVLMSRPYADADGAFDIVSIGTGSQRTGMIKSVQAGGRWNGRVYVVPFHSQVAVETVAAGAVDNNGRRGSRPGSDFVWSIDQAYYGDLFEFSFQASASQSTQISLGIVRGSQPLEPYRIEVPVGEVSKAYRLLVKMPMVLTDFSFKLEAGDASVQITDLQVLRHSDQSTKIRQGQFKGTRHRGGVSFDVLARSEPFAAPGRGRR